MIVQISLDAAKLVTDLRADPHFEGDLTSYSSDAVVECLKAGVVKIYPCTRPLHNMKLTKLGQTAELNAGTPSKT